jgi:hypothetical protein
MRRAVLVVTFVSCGGLLLLCLVGLALVWLGEVNTLVLPDAADMQSDRPGSSVPYHWVMPTKMLTW